MEGGESFQGLGFLMGCICYKFQTHQFPYELIQPLDLCPVPFMASLGCCPGTKSSLPFYSWRNQEDTPVLRFWDAANPLASSKVGGA